MTKQKNFRVIRPDGSATDYTTLEVRAEVALEVKAVAAARSITVSEYLREMLELGRPDEGDDATTAHEA